MNAATESDCHFLRLKSGQKHTHQIHLTSPHLSPFSKSWAFCPWQPWLSYQLHWRRLRPFSWWTRSTGQDKCIGKATLWANDGGLMLWHGARERLLWSWICWSHAWFQGRVACLYPYRDTRKRSHDVEQSASQLRASSTTILVILQESAPH